MSKVRVPIRVRSSYSGQLYSRAVSEVAGPAPAVADRVRRDNDIASDGGRGVDMRHSEKTLDLESSKDMRAGNMSGLDKVRDDAAVWRDRALRLQAEMENFRKRQERLSEDRVLGEQERLLRAFLEVADDVARALDADCSESDEGLREGVRLTHHKLMSILGREGVTAIEAIGQPFDPSVHEAVGTVPHELTDLAPDTIVELVRDGYMFKDRLLRPARVVVAT